VREEVEDEHEDEAPPPDDDDWSLRVKFILLLLGYAEVSIRLEGEEGKEERERVSEWEQEREIKWRVWVSVQGMKVGGGTLQERWQTRA